MKIENLPRFHLADMNTPLEEMKRMRAKLGGPKLFIKRDDLIGLAMGGNKIRKLEFLIGDALSKGADTLITAGGIQSNHCRLTAAAAVKAGLACELVISGEPPELPDGNLLLDRLFGANVNWCTREQRDAEMEAVADRLRAEGRRPYVIPVGGSNNVGTVGYVLAMGELVQQLRQHELRVDYVVVASSSGGTQAGLMLGAEIFGFKGKILGISIDQVKTGKAAFPPVLAHIANTTADRLGTDIKLREQDFMLNCDYLGAGYAVPGDLEREAIETTSRTEGILLGPVYTGRAMGGMFDIIRKGFFQPEETVVFWHTGGTPELFAYNHEFI
ncbi:MAG: D-cysteine desulfhydrase family protein [Deltaproteobacteria bacterium]|nr:D-cysteine desulfhydrase family protein [Deltaproteobacteria bacterium]